MLVLVLRVVKLCGKILGYIFHQGLIQGKKFQAVFVLLRGLFFPDQTAGFIG